MSRRVFYMGYSRASVLPLLLDLFPNAAVAYSLRRMRAAYTGAAIRVRRSNDNAEQDIGFSGDDLDTAALLAFVGGVNGFVTSWYDQSGNGLNATQTSAARQPIIVFNGSIYMENSRPVVRNPARNVFRDLDVPLSTLQPLPLTAIFAGRVIESAVNAFGDGSFYLGGSASTGGGSRYELVSSTTPSNFRVNRRSASGAGSIAITESPFNTDPFIQQAFFRTSQIDGRQNQTDATPSSYVGTPFNLTSNFRLLGSQGGSVDPIFYANLSAFEYIIYLSDQHANRVGIEDNINNYYNIYP